MTHSFDAQTPPERTRAEPIPPFTCAEVWGGNRPINAPIQLPGVSGWVFSRPSEGSRGGDIHYVSICSSGLISRFCLADVAGHGEQVARVSAEIHRLLRKYMNNPDQRRVLVELNRRLTDSRIGIMTTAAAASFFPPTRTLSVSYAGHPPGWLFRSRSARWMRLTQPGSPPDHGRPPSRTAAPAGQSGQPGKPGPAELRAGESPPARTGSPDLATRLLNLPLAVDSRTAFSRQKIRVDLGDRLLLVTDGVLETPSSVDGELFGDSRMDALLRAHSQAGVDELVDLIIGALTAYAGGRTLWHDDLTLLVLQFVPGPRGFGILHGLKNRILGRRPRQRLEPVGLR